MLLKSLIASSVILMEKLFSLSANASGNAEFIVVIPSQKIITTH
jgi:hypothetical protein